jgi:hypothetical protein
VLNKTRETQTRRELSWGKAIWGGTDQQTDRPMDEKSYKGTMLAPKNSGKGGINCICGIPRILFLDFLDLIIIVRAQLI